MAVQVRTRIAPSPTGFPHIGTIYQVLIDYVYARKCQGKFILRLEDTDRNRFVDGAEEGIYDALNWFGLLPDESPLLGGPFGPYRQSERLPVYKKYVEELLAKGHAYYCFCTKERLEAMRIKQGELHEPPMYDKHCRNLELNHIQKQLDAGVPRVVRLKIPKNRTIVLEDVVSGTIEFDSNLIDDQVILKSDGFPTYHLGVVVDDHLMEISHVFRGKEWISSTPKHILLYEFFGWIMPIHGHLPLILNADGKGKLSKRHAHASVDFYRTLGYLPEAIINYLSHIVWNHPEGKEIYSLEEFITLFEIEKITSQAPRFDLQKLDWVNKEYIKAMSDATLYERLVQFDPSIGALTKSEVLSVLPLIKVRLKVLSEFWFLAGFFFRGPKEYERPIDKKLLTLSQKALESSDWNHSEMEKAIRAAAEKEGVVAKDVFMELRIAITGKTVGPPLLESLEILGKEETLERLSSI